MAGNDTLSTSQVRAIANLMSSRTVADAAKASCVPIRTLRRWIHQDCKFGQELRRRETELLEDAARGATKFTRDAIGVLTDVMTDPNEPGSVRSRAACSVLDYGIRLNDTLAMASRISALEESIDGTEKTGR